MFSIKKLKEKSKQREKHWKKHYEVDKLDESINDTQKTYLSLDIGTSSKNFREDDDDGVSEAGKKKKKKSKIGLSWRLFNQITDGGKENVLGKEDISITGIDHSETTPPLDLHQTLDKFHNTKSIKIRELKRKLSKKEANKKVQENPLKRSKKVSLGEGDVKRTRKSAGKMDIDTSDLVETTSLCTLDNSEIAKEFLKKPLKNKKSKKIKKKRKNEQSDGEICSSPKEKCNSINNSEEISSFCSSSISVGENESLKMKVLPNTISKYEELTKQKEFSKPVNFVPSSESYIDVTSTNENNLLVALYPGTKIYISGDFELKVIVGSVSVLGYTFKEGEMHPIFSPPTHSLLPINVLAGVVIKEISDKQLNKLEIPLNWIRNLNVHQNALVAIVNISRYESNMTRILSNSPLMRREKQSENVNFDNRWSKNLNISFVENPKMSRLQLLNESEEWKEVTNSMMNTIENKKRTCIVVSGGKGVGKSTFLKYLLNSFLNANTREVACMDLDPGQPEFFVPSTISLVKFSDPLLGPSFTHREYLNYFYQENVLLGELSVNNVLKEYLDIVRSLASKLENFESTTPVVVNTMGFTANVGFDIMIDILRILQPTHVITIESKSQHQNFPCQLKSDIINSSNRGVIRNYSYGNLNYSLTVMRSLSYVKKTSKDLRDISILSHLSKLWNDNEDNIIGDSCKQPIQVLWSEVAIHICGAFVPYNQVLQAINASLVALCHVDENFLEYTGNDMPLKVEDGSPWLVTNQCIGWGVVRGIDPVSRKIHILTQLTNEEVSNGVNLIAMPKAHLPNQFYELFNAEEAPYWQKNGS